MPRFLLHHRHAPDECGAAYASFKGGTSPLRHHAALASCGEGGHAMWWTVEAADETEALGLLPYFVVEPDSALIPELIAWTQDRLDGRPPTPSCGGR